MKKILVVDDDIAMVRLYEMQMRRAGYACYSFQTGKAALADAAKIAPDIIILDFELPDMKGIDVIRALRADVAFAKVPMITVTGQGKSGLKSELLAAGAVEVFTKPFSPALLLRSVQQLLKS
ncbi:MAG: response regulator [Verrucomicrobiota bacterium]|nr:response regulator [Verrucomicrobiota bacterium]